MIAILLLALISSPIGEVSEAVDCIELNNVHNACGERTLSQYIFWGRDGVRAWTMEDGKQLSHSNASGLWTLGWFDENAKVWRRVFSANLKTTWTQHDREREDLKKLPENQRVKLIGQHSKPTVQPVEESE